jgi:predicted TIM-barrel fold metal-dependent hydrolase
MYPLDNSLLAENPDRKFFFSREDKLLRRYLNDLGLGASPSTLDEYLKQVVTPTLERQKARGAVAVKFEAAYLRSLDFAPAAEIEARAVYGEYFGSGTPENARYKTLQDFLFHYIASEAGRLRMALHIHTGAGCGGYFKLGGANPVLLDSVINDASLRKTNFVLVHGGPPYSHVTAFLLSKPNVYADFSEQTWLYGVRALARNVRDWLEWYPEKVLFGTDLYPDTGRPEIGWEEIGWQTADVGRRALALALTRMMRDSEIPRKRALELARMALHDNAAKLYGIN